MSELEEKIVTLKARGYDLYARVQYFERQLAEVNRELAALYQVKNAQATELDSSTDVVS